MIFNKFLKKYQLVLFINVVICDNDNDNDNKIKIKFKIKNRKINNTISIDEISIEHFENITKG